MGVKKYLHDSLTLSIQNNYRTVFSFIYHASDTNILYHTINCHNSIGRLSFDTVYFMSETICSCNITLNDRFPKIEVQ